MDAIEAIEILKNNQCRCGAGKLARMAFCRHCFYKLPQPIRKALYTRVGFGFEQAYQLAERTLDEVVSKNGKQVGS
jgi:hypothetical protein